MICEIRSGPTIARGTSVIARFDRNGLDFVASGPVCTGDDHRTDRGGQMRYDDNVRAAKFSGNRKAASR